jgi:hemolysin III
MAAFRWRAVSGVGLSKPARTYPGQSEAERTADLAVLAGGLVLGLAASIALFAASLARGDPRLLIGVVLYVAGLLAMLGCSLLYRAAIEPRRRQFLRRFDHAAIFAMIAGTATPFALTHGGLYGVGLTAALWAVAAVGVIIKLRYPIGGIRRSVVAYLVLGWASLIALGPSVSHQTVVLIAAGGGFYSVGVWFLLSRRLPYRLAMWHAFVIAGAACHYFAIVTGVVLA